MRQLVAGLMAVAQGGGGVVVVVVVVVVAVAVAVAVAAAAAAVVVLSDCIGSGNMQLPHSRSRVPGEDAAARERMRQRKAVPKWCAAGQHQNVTGGAMPNTFTFGSLMLGFHSVWAMHCCHGKVIIVINEQEAWCVVQCRAEDRYLMQIQKQVDIDAGQLSLAVQELGACRSL